MLKGIDNNANRPDIKRKLEEVYSPIAMEVHTASHLHRKQRSDEILQEYIQNFMQLTGKAVTRLTLPIM